MENFIICCTAVRYGRVPKRSKSLDEQKVTTTEGSQDLTVAESKQLAIYDIILTISQAHHANCAYTEDKIRTLVKKKVSLVCCIIISIKTRIFFYEI